jgi:hypothetical protein
VLNSLKEENIMYAYQSNSNGFDNVVHHPHRFEVLVHKIEMDASMLTAVFTMSLDGTIVKFTGLIKGDPSVMAARMATEFHSWHFSNRNMLTIPQLKEKMEMFVSGLAIVNEQ